MSIDILKRQVRQVQILAFDRFDKLQTSNDDLLSLLCLTVDNRREKQNPVRLEEDFYWPEAYAWEDEMVSVPGFDKLDFVIPIKGFASMIPYNRVNIDRPDTVAKLERMMPRLAEAHIRLQVRQAMAVFRTNPTSVDGQAFFADAHPTPGKTGITYDNLLAPNWTSPTIPTDEEVLAVIESIRAQFAANLTVDAEVVDSSVVDGALAIITHNASAEAAFRRARDYQTLTIGSIQVPNPNRGTFRLFLDKKPTSGQEGYLEAIYSLPGGPRPVIRVLDKDPTVDAIESNRVSNALVEITMESQFGMKAGDPSTAIQVRPT